MNLKSSPKLPDFHRGSTPEQTLNRLQPLLKFAGITRMSDITGLDRIGIPVWSSVVPKSPDVLSVYNGKGATHMGAKVGAMMEAFERNAAFLVQGSILRGSYNAFSKQRRTLDPESMVVPMRPGYGKDKEIAWTTANDLVTGEEILVPADLVWMGLDPELRTYAFSSSNGLSAGNTYEEAVCQGLCEIIERDAWTIAEVLSHWMPRARFEAARAKAGLPKISWDGEGEQPFEDDPNRYPEVDPNTLTGELRRVYGMYQAAGLPVSIRDITADTGIPTMIAMVIEEVSPDFPRAHAGVGTHPDPMVATMRALTEAAQSRAVDIQGVREDMRGAGEVVPASQMHAKRMTHLNRKYWLVMKCTRQKSFQEIPRIRNEDTLGDIQLMVDRLRSVGLETVIGVNLTNPAAGIPVTRVIVPGAESWAIDHGRLGKRATQHWNASRKR